VDLLKPAWRWIIRRKHGRGVTFLNREKPLWPNSIDPIILDMNDRDHCVLAQVYGEGYSEACRSLNISGSNYGFDLPQMPIRHRGAYFAYLKSLWLEERERQLAEMSEDV